MTIDMSVVLSGVGLIFALIGGGYTLMRHINGRCAEVARDAAMAQQVAQTAHAADIKDLDHKIELIRADCARREDIHEIKNSLHGMTLRIDGIFRELVKQGNQA